MHVLGIDGGTEGVRAFVFNTDDGSVVSSHAVPYTTSYPRPAWAEQSPAEWWNQLGVAVRGAVGLAASAGLTTFTTLCVDTTCCSVCALDAAGDALRPALLWADVRAVAQAARVAATGDSGLCVNGGGPVSAEWFIPKCLWLSDEEPATFAAAKYIVEYQDFINFQLTGRMVASTTNASVRWHWVDGVAPPISLLGSLGLSSLLSKMPHAALAPGAHVGGLTPAAAAHLGLPPGLMVAQGGADAFIGMLGLGVVRPGMLALLTGSSHLHLGVTSSRAHGKGVWGAYGGVLPLPGASPCFILEGGQTSTGSVAAWVRRLVSSDQNSLVPYALLDSEAAAVPPGCEGLLCLDHFQGGRTPITDGESRGAFVGLTLRHSRGHLFRAVLEGVAFGTRAVLEAMAALPVPFKPDVIAIAGGAARSPLWLQLTADVVGLPLRVTRCGDAPALGCAMLAAVAAGAHADVGAAAAAMVQVERVVTPNAAAHEAYTRVYEAYKLLYAATSPVVRAAAAASARTSRG